MFFYPNYTNIDKKQKLLPSSFSVISFDKFQIRFFTSIGVAMATNFDVKTT